MKTKKNNKNKERYRLVTSSMKQFLETENKPPREISVRYERILTAGRNGLEDLAYLAQKLPENKQAEIFTDERLKPLVEAILIDDYSLSEEDFKVLGTYDSAKAAREKRQLKIAAMFAKLGLQSLQAGRDRIVSHELRRIISWITELQIQEGIRASKQR